MISRVFLAATVAAATFAATAEAATITVTSGAADAAAFAAVDKTQTTALPSDAIGFDVALASITKTGNSSGNWRSPFDPSHGVNLAGWETLPYFSIGPSTVAQATLTFSKLMTGLSFLWGSIDNYNGLEFCNSTTSECATAVSSMIQPPPNGGDHAQAGAQLIYFSDFDFDSVRFYSSTNALEFSNLIATPRDRQTPTVPLPAGGVLLLGALAALRTLRRRA